MGALSFLLDGIKTHEKSNVFNHVERGWQVGGAGVRET